MATENYPQDQVLSGFITDEAVTKNLAAKWADGGEVENCDTAGERSIGVTLDTQTSVGKVTPVLAGPAFKLVVSGAQWTGYELAVDADGKYRTATAGQVVVAIAQELASAADQLKRAFLLPPSQYRLASVGLADLVAIAGGEAPTEAEHNLVVAKVNAIIAVLEAHGITLPV